MNFERGIVINATKIVGIVYQSSNHGMETKCFHNISFNILSVYGSNLVHRKVIHNAHYVSRLPFVILTINPLEVPVV